MYFRGLRRDGRKVIVRFTGDANTTWLDELEPIPEEEDASARHLRATGDLESHGLVDVMDDLTRHDSERLRAIIERHAHYTGSKRAREILDAWQDYLPKFRKVMPVEYRKALEEMERAQAEQPIAVAGD